jgi:pyruvate-formate lyase
MFNVSRRSIKAQEESTKAVRRSTAALNSIADTMREMIREEDAEAQTPPPLPSKGATPPKTQPPKK